MSLVTPEVAESLREAGIGKRYHDMALADAGKEGVGLLEWLLYHGEGVKAGTTSVLFEGTGMTDLIMLLARGLHINGVGCKIVPLARMRQVIQSAEFRETVNEIDCLVILNAQDRHRGNPLHDSVAAEVEYLIRQRYDNRRSTFLQAAFSGAGTSEDRSYWSDEFWELVGKFEKVTMNALSGDWYRKSVNK